MKVSVVRATTTPFASINSGPSGLARRCHGAATGVAVWLMPSVWLVAGRTEHHETRGRHEYRARRRY